MLLCLSNVWLGLAFVLLQVGGAHAVPLAALAGHGCRPVLFGLLRHVRFAADDSTQLLCVEVTSGYYCVCAAGQRASVGRTRY